MTPLDVLAFAFRSKRGVWSTERGLINEARSLLAWTLFWAAVAGLTTWAAIRVGAASPLVVGGM